MYVPFDQLPDHSRIWIYQSSRKLNTEEKNYANQALRTFCEGWVAHQQPLKTSFRIEYDQFIVLATDEDYHLPSGCSIDSSVRALKEIQNAIGVDLFDRTRVAFLTGTEVVLHPLARLKQLFEAGELTGESLTFDNLVPSKGEMERRWKTAAENTWLTKYLPNPALAKRS